MAPLHIRCAPAHGLVALAWLSVRCGGVRVLSSFSPLSSPYSGKQGLLFNSFSIELTVQCDGCLIWGLGWRAGLVAGLRVGQAYGVSHRPGFGLLGSVPRSLSTQPPFATQALMPCYRPKFLVALNKFHRALYGDEWRPLSSRNSFDIYKKKYHLRTSTHC